MKVRVVLADRHPVVIAGLSYFFSHVKTIDITGTAESSKEAVELLKQGNCDVLVTDFSLSGGKYGDGLTFIADVRRRFPEVKIVVFTMMSNPAIINQLGKLGVRSVMSKSEKLDYLIAAIHAVYAGAAFFSAARGDSSQATSSRFVPGYAQPELSKREIEVVRLFASGMSINEIAAYMHRTKQTVSTQKISAMRKLGLSREADLYQYAFESGILCHPINFSDPA
jgi:two-component system capsular synthesis response regulator RcsB